MGMSVWEVRKVQVFPTQLTDGSTSRLSSNEGRCPLGLCSVWTGTIQLDGSVPIHYGV